MMKPTSKEKWEEFKKGILALLELQGELFSKPTLNLILNNFDYILTQAIEEERGEIYTWATKNRCSCEGRKHDPEDLMGKLMAKLGEKGKNV